MGIMDAASDLVEKGKAALDADADGKVEVQEVADAVVDRVKETAEAAAVAAGEVKKGFDADGDGSVTFDEGKLTAEAAAKKVSDAVTGLVDKVKGE